MNLYSIFHINTSYSSLEKKNIKNVLKLCYWPLLNLIERNDFKIGIEASANSLIEINNIDKSWLKKLRYLIYKKKVEFIGSGYTQAIFPIIPFEVNNMNLKLGDEAYKKILKVKPRVALINEQIFSKSLVPIYKKNGYKALVVDWKNSKLANKKLNNSTQYNCQITEDDQKNKIKIIWSNSLIFQKFQNYIHKEIDKQTFLKFLNKHKGNGKNICIYSNDVEIFNFRPGRFENEAKLQKKNEWDLIEDLFLELKSKKFQFIFPSNLLNKSKKTKVIQITSPNHPIISKKQSKYNLIRWSLTGRDDLFINTICFKIYKFLLKKNIKNKIYWKKLCFLWSSDFRTHITQKRWGRYLDELNKFGNKFKKITKLNINREKNKNKITYFDNFLLINNNNIQIKLNLIKGLTIESYIDYRISNLPLFGRIEKGYFNDINYDVDFFSGFFQLNERLSNKKITDLSQKISHKNILIENSSIIQKKFFINGITFKKKFIFELNKKRFGIQNEFFNIPAGFLRFNYITLNPQNFDFKNLYFSTHNGGKDLEKFNLNKENFDYGSHVSTFCSATSGLGMTKGFLIISDNKKTISIDNDDSCSNLIGMIQNKRINNKRLFRFYQSGLEYDDTSKFNKKKDIQTLTWFKLTK